MASQGFFQRFASTVIGKVLLSLLVLFVASVIYTLVTHKNQDENWYANGKAWAIAANQAQGGARLMGPSASTYCWGIMNNSFVNGNTKAVGISLNAPRPLTASQASPANGTKVQNEQKQWVAGCIAGTQ
jgi:hypothetical protein